MARLAGRRRAFLCLRGDDLLVDQVGEWHLRLARSVERGGQGPTQNVIVVTIGLALQTAELRLGRRFRAPPIPHPDRFPEGVAPAKRNVESAYFHFVRRRINRPIKALQAVYFVRIKKRAI